MKQRRIKLKLGYIQRVPGGWLAVKAAHYLQKPWMFADVGSALKWLGYSPISAAPARKEEMGV